MKLTDADLLRVIGTWMPDRRWFAAKGHRLAGLRVASRVAVPAAPGEHLVIAAHVDGRQWQAYQVPVRYSDQHDPASAIGVIDGIEVQDGLAHHDVVAGLLGTGAGPAALDPANDPGPPHARWAAPGGLAEQYRVLAVEQSNTSGVFGDAVLVKFFRMLNPGINPDIEVHAGLSGVGCQDVGRLLGWLNGGWRDPASGQTVHGHLAMIQQFYPGSVDGWDLARAVVARGEEFTVDAHALGEATARVHRDLAAAFPTADLEHQQVGAMAQRLHQRLSAAAQIVPGLRELEPALHSQLERVADLPGLRVQRVHGDLHLGQVLRTRDGWRLLDFEGEPGGDVESRRVLDHPMRDVAGMLRSFAYAAWQGGGNSDAAQGWSHRCQQAYLAAYGATAGVDPGDHRTLLTAYLIDKSAYEAVYEQRNRPDWVGIPLSALQELARG